MRQAFARRELNRELKREQPLGSTLVRRMVRVTAVVLAGLVHSACATASEELPTLEETTSEETSPSALQPDSPQSIPEPAMSEPNESATTTPPTTAPIATTTMELYEETSELNESATTTPPTTAPIATTTSETTTTLEQHEQAPHLFDLPGNDLVIVRTGPGASTEKVTQIQAPMYAIEGTSRVETDEFGTAWRELHMYAGHGYLSTGWIEADRLEISEQTQVSFFDEPCAKAGVSEGAVTVDGLPGGSAASSTPSGAADHLAQMWQLQGPGCNRLHVALGTDWDYGRGGELASEAPGGVTAEAFGSWARITVPGLEGARFDADLDDTWNLTAMAPIRQKVSGVVTAVDGDDARDLTAMANWALDVYAPDCDFMRQLALSGLCVDHEIKMAINVYATAPSEFAVRVLSNPARLLIDVIPAESISDAATAAVLKLFVSSNTIVPLHASGDNSLIEVTLPWTVRGYALGWFESSGDVDLYFADGSRALGSIKGDGVVRPGISTGWGVQGGGGYWTWGDFEFTIEAVALPPEGTAKEYQLRVGGHQPNEDAIFEGVTIPFRLTD